MIHWAWLIPVFFVGVWLGEMSGKRFSRGALTGVVGTVLTLLWIS